MNKPFFNRNPFFFNDVIDDSIFDNGFLNGVYPLLDFDLGDEPLYFSILLAGFTLGLAPQVANHDAHKNGEECFKVAHGRVRILHSGA